MQKTNSDIESVRAFHQAGQLDQAKDGYLTLLEKNTNPELQAWALNNLGTIYYKQNNLTAALEAYRRAIALQSDYVDAYYNLGLVLVKQDLLEEARLNYQTILQQSPTHDAARFHLACIYMRQEKIDQALTEFLVIEAAQPYHFETQTNLATCYLKKGVLNQAKQHYVSALSLVPNDVQILFNLGVINMQQGYLDQAIQYYQKALSYEPDVFAVHNNLGVAFLAKQHAGLALQHFQQALRIQPTNQGIGYIVEMLKQNKQLLAAPMEYVKTLFDNYADHYEPHLLQALDYQVPPLFKKIAEKELHAKTAFDILDLGCGTGLCGDIIKPYAKTLIGVDLSEKMLALAAAKKCYDQLIAQDITSFLSDKNQQYDVILAGDVLVYVGELENIFSQSYQALRLKGFFIFNAEINDEQDFRLNQSGRFSHHKNYIEKLAEKYGFTLVQYEIAVTRMQHDGQVWGHVYVLQK